MAGQATEQQNPYENLKANPDENLRGIIKEIDELKNPDSKDDKIESDVIVKDKLNNSLKDYLENHKDIAKILIDEINTNIDTKKLSDDVRQSLHNLVTLLSGIYRGDTEQKPTGTTEQKPAGATETSEVEKSKSSFEKFKKIIEENKLKDLNSLKHEVDNIKAFINDNKNNITTLNLYAKMVTLPTEAYKRFLSTDRKVFESISTTIREHFKMNEKAGVAEAKRIQLGMFFHGRTTKESLKAIAKRYLGINDWDGKDIPTQKDGKFAEGVELIASYEEFVNAFNRKNKELTPTQETPGNTPAPEGNGNPENTPETDNNGGFDKTVERKGIRMDENRVKQINEIAGEHAFLKLDGEKLSYNSDKVKAFLTTIATTDSKDFRNYYRTPGNPKRTAWLAAAQILLNENVQNNKVVVDGEYKGKGETYKITLAYQKHYNEGHQDKLKEDGIPGPKTLSKLLGITENNGGGGGGNGGGNGGIEGGNGGIEGGNGGGNGGIEGGNGGGNGGIEGGNGGGNGGIEGGNGGGNGGIEGGNGGGNGGIEGGNEGLDEKIFYDYEKEIINTDSEKFYEGYDYKSEEIEAHHHYKRGRIIENIKSLIDNIKENEDINHKKIIEEIRGDLVTLPRNEKINIIKGVHTVVKKFETIRSHLKDIKNNPKKRLCDIRKVDKKDTIRLNPNELKGEITVQQKGIQLIYFIKDDADYYYTRFGKKWDGKEKIESGGFNSKNSRIPEFEGTLTVVRGEDKENNGSIDTKQRVVTAHEGQHNWNTYFMAEKVEKKDQPIVHAKDEIIAYLRAGAGSIQQIEDTLTGKNNSLYNYNLSGQSLENHRTMVRELLSYVRGLMNFVNKGIIKIDKVISMLSDTPHTERKNLYNNVKKSVDSGTVGQDYWRAGTETQEAEKGQINLANSIKEVKHILNDPKYSHISWVPNNKGGIEVSLIIDKRMEKAKNTPLNEIVGFDYIPQDIRQKVGALIIKESPEGNREKLKEELINSFPEQEKEQARKNIESQLN